MQVRKSYLILILVLMAMLAGCGGSTAPNSPGEEVPWEEVAVENMPEEIQKWVEENYRERGNYSHFTAEGGYFLVAWGEQPTGGYRVVIAEITSTADGLEVVASLHPPQPGEMVTQVITYPYALVFAPGVEQQPVNFTVGEAGAASPVGNSASGAPAGNVQVDSGTYVGQIDGNSIEIEVSGAPQGQVARAFRLSDMVKSSFAGLGLESGDPVRFTYTLNEHGQAVITGIEKTW
ncbi:MAG: protease complex subunit PrcB family protein [Clostridia bacterium]|nr:MAG: protease complex subunit PrcB family protein [Clostridia bacterium]